MYVLELHAKLVCKRFCPIQVLGVRGHVRGVAGPLPLGERQVRRRQVQVGQRASIVGRGYSDITLPGRDCRPINTSLSP